jgi:FAD/FMN-containing dehydrogenase
MATSAFGETKMTNLQALRAQVIGDVITPDDSSYNTARLTWDLSVDQYPAIIVMAENAEDVAAGVRFASANGLSVVVQGTGHGSMHPGNGALLINTSRMQTVRVNAEAQTAWVDAGVKWQKVLDAATPLGLAGLLGSSPDVGVVGYTLGGGMGWLARKYGYSADSVNRIEIVTPDGVLRNASADENAELFWGLRGGGSNFGVVTGMEIRLYPVKVLYGGTLFYPMEMFADALRFFREWVKNVPDEMTSSVTMMAFPPIPDVPEPLRGKRFTLLKFGFSGAPEWGKLLVDQWRAWAAPIIDMVGIVPFSEVATISADPVDPLAAAVANELFNELTDEAIEVFTRYASAENAPLAFTGIRHMGGALAHADRGGNAIGNRDAQFVAEILAVVPTPEIGKLIADYIAAFKDELYPHATGGVYLNFIQGSEAEQRARDAYAPGTFERLMALKAKYDPNNMFRYSFSIPVAEPEEAFDWETEMDAVLC